MSVSYRLTKDERRQLLMESIAWRSVVEQVVLLLESRNDQDIGTVTGNLIRFLNDEKNVRRAMNMSLNCIIDLMRHSQHE